MKSKQKILERNGKRWSYCHGTPSSCMLHYHDSKFNTAQIPSLEENYHYFHQDLNHLEYEEKSLTFLNLLSKEEQIAVANYADSGYHSINRSLKYEGEVNHALINDIDSSIKKAAMGLKTVYRGVKSDLNNKVGDLVEFKGYISSSLNPHKAVEFSDRQSPIILMFNTRLGAPISIVHKEMEVVLPRDSKFKLVDIIESDFTCVYPDTDYTVSYGNSKIYSFIDAI